MSESKIKKFLPRSLLGRSLMILVTPVLIIQAFTTFMFFDRHWDEVTERLAFALAGEIAIIADRYENEPNSQSASMISNYAREFLNLDVTFEGGETLEIKNEEYIFWAAIAADSLAEALDKYLQRPHDIALSLEEKWVVVHVQLDNGKLTVNAPIRRLFSSSSYVFLLWMVGSSLLMLAIAILFMRNQIRPIRKLAVAAERFGKGQEVSYLKPSGAREVRAAAQAFLTMRERLDRQIQQRTSMLAGVSHDLRTPLTRMKLQVAMLEDQMEDQKTIESLKKDMGDMERMINAYLDFVRGEGDEDLQRMDVRLLMESVVDVLSETNAKIHTSVDEKMTLMLRPIAFRRCLVNLVGNAAKYADNVWVHASKTGKDAFSIVIDDDGPGVDETLYDDLFKPFFRVESSRNQKTGGVGLGLPIARDIVHSHGGEISLHKSEKSGLKVVIELPL
ncbi:MAG: ATP-binding protein [Pseudomonadota bacterium]